MQLIIIKAPLLTLCSHSLEASLCTRKFRTGDKTGMTERAVISEEILGTRNDGVLVPALTLTLILPFL